MNINTDVPVATVFQTLTGLTITSFHAVHSSDAKLDPFSVREFQS